MIAVRPPEYFPRLAYVALMQAVDCFVVADTFAYSRQSFQNRGRLRNPQGWQWISVPLQAGQRGRPIRTHQINTNGRWLQKHWRAFQYNYRSTPYFEYFEPQVEPFFQKAWTHLGPLTCASVALTHELVGLSTTLVRASDLDGAPDTLADILAVMGRDDLLAPEAAAHHDRKAAPRLSVFRFDTPEYRQNFEGFEPGMSAVDVLFNYGPEARALLAQGTHIDATDVDATDVDATEQAAE